MKKGFVLFLALFPLLFNACLDSGDEDTLDLKGPIIGSVDDMQTIMPSYFLEVGTKVFSIPLAFQVEDETGISEITIESHSGFDGHTHGRKANSNNFVLFGYSHTIRQQDLEDPRLFQSEVADDLRIYLDDRNVLIPNNGLILAGPYHFSIKATDTEGNETSYADNSTYHTTLYIHREYAPLIHVDAIDRTTGTVEGSVRRNSDHEFSSDITFLWAYISRPDFGNPAQEGEIRKEWVWGESNWPHQFRGDTGEGLANPQNIDLAGLLAGEEAVRQMGDTETLTIWAEDANGNISVRSF
ncbi:DUF4625 domain-containing protein [Fulvivirga sp. M361]|uniref:DUF4625 domain-containing protein n=1 Tax=Fulvivirga sp. M361 TaxID=2594266 RepID=UPI00117B5216|nr:DUF4625 domain-containing protein [Fulvivirga sp. M361]TRX54821.1 DUF4625 domain-containing protein [Fulvivirga sp. M361]